MSFTQNGAGFAVDFFTFECALTVERCALLLITPFIEKTTQQYGHCRIFRNPANKKIGH